MYLAKQKIDGIETGKKIIRNADNYQELIDELRAHGVEGEFDILDDSEITEDDIDDIIRQTEKTTIWKVI
jgi:arsenate reductase-like glutaredoxin family protein